ncbi:hypothetical protein SDC9_172354 [bioreactor metagenome]|uniref:Uncharacterized protein n=1 Tax=bioreactor metagenome TaxID=1076179 RepID=A0A645GDH2_9ZZZZ
MIPFIGQGDLWEKLYKILVWLHHRWIHPGLFSNRSSLGNVILLFGVVMTGIGVFNISGFTAPVHRNFACIFRNLYEKIVVHFYSFLRMISYSIKYNKNPAFPQPKTWGTGSIPCFK